jgi:hypothetical protein
MSNLPAQTPRLFVLQLASGGLCKEVNGSSGLSSSYCRMSQRELSLGLEEEDDIQRGNSLSSTREG